MTVKEYAVWHPTGILGNCKQKYFIKLCTLILTQIVLATPINTTYGEHRLFVSRY